MRLIGRTTCGRATVEVLNLNNEIALVVRQHWVSQVAVEELISEIGKQTQQPIKYAVNTHLPGHTGGDVLVYVPDAKVMFTGDMGWSKTLPNLVDATVNHWIPSLDLILSNHPGAKFIPGHGEVATAVEMRDFRDYLDDMRSRVKKAIIAGLTLDQAKEQLTLPEKYKSFAFQNFAQPNIEDMYKELKETKQTK